MRKQIVAGNWKMNLTSTEAYKLGHKIEKYVIDNILEPNNEIILSPPFLYLETLANNMHLLSNVKLAAQNCHHETAGAYTGEVAAPMLHSLGIDCVILGHSERRAYFKESNELIRNKVDIVLKHDLQPIFCCGENEAERENGNYKEFVESQLEESLFHLAYAELERCVVAYEPVWAIGTGKTASPEQAQEMHAYIRFLIEQKYGKAVADNISILYGGSCKPGNASEIFSGPDVDGGLIGGASLVAEDFIAIVEALQA